MLGGKSLGVDCLACCVLFMVPFFGWVLCEGVLAKVVGEGSSLAGW